MKSLTVAVGVFAAATFFLADFSAGAADTAKVPLVSINKSFQASKVVVDNFAGTLTIEAAAPGSPISVRATGKPETIKRLDVRQDPNGVLIRMESVSERMWWPWAVLNWDHQRYDELVLVVIAPKGTEFDMDDIAGRLSAGDLDAPLRFGGVGGGTANFGNVTRARISVSGSMAVRVGTVSSDLDVEIAGSGTVITGSAKSARLEVAGSGDAKIGALTGGLDLDMAGSGNSEIAAVNGPVDIDLAGSGDVLIRSGRAQPFRVSIAGSGNVVFNGEAVDTDIDIVGSGDVTVGTTSGSLSQSIQGSGDFVAKGKPTTPTPPAPPTSPSPPAAVAPPAAPAPPSAP